LKEGRGSRYEWEAIYATVQRKLQLRKSIFNESIRDSFTFKVSYMLKSIPFLLPPGVFKSTRWKQKDISYETSLLSFNLEIMFIEWFLPIVFKPISKPETNMLLLCALGFGGLPLYTIQRIVKVVVTTGRDAEFFNGVWALFDLNTLQYILTKIKDRNAYLDSREGVCSRITDAGQCKTDNVDIIILQKLATSSLSP